MNKKYAIFAICSNDKIEIANGFTGDGKWLPDLRFDSREDAEKALDDSYSFSGSITLEFVILEVLCN